MKKLTLTIAIVLGLGMMSFAGPNGGGLFQRGETPEKEGVYGNREGGLVTPGFPGHGETTNQNAPLGTGIAVLAALGGAYLIGKRHKQE